MPSSSERKLEKPHKDFPKGSVCKPCWELKYCPYGYLVEFFPLLPADGNLTDKKLKEIRRLHEELVDRFLSGKIKTEDELAVKSSGSSIYHPRSGKRLRRMTQKR